jgi:hypothetical protein
VALLCLGISLQRLPWWLCEIAAAWDQVDHTAGRIRLRHLRNRQRRARAGSL